MHYAIRCPKRLSVADFVAYLFSQDRGTTYLHVNTLQHRSRGCLGSCSSLKFDSKLCFAEFRLTIQSSSSLHLTKKQCHSSADSSFLSSFSQISTALPYSRRILDPRLLTSPSLRHVLTSPQSCSNQLNQSIPIGIIVALGAYFSALFSGILSTTAQSLGPQYALVLKLRTA